MKKTGIALLALFLIGCDGDSEPDPIVCPAVVTPAISITMYDASQSEPLNVCGAIVTYSSASESEVYYGDAIPNCEMIDQVQIGQYAESYELLLEKAGYQNVEFEDIKVEETECGLDTYALEVTLTES